MLYKILTLSECLYAVICDTFSPFWNFVHILVNKSSKSLAYVLTLNRGLSIRPLQTLALMALLNSASLPSLTAMFS